MNLVLHNAQEEDIFPYGKGCLIGVKRELIEEPPDEGM